MKKNKIILAERKTNVNKYTRLTGIKYVDVKNY